MKKIDLGQTIQILANLGVIAGIVFLGIEVQQNNTLLGAQTRTSRTQLRVDGLQSLMSNLELLQARVKLREGQALTPVEQMQLDMDVTRQLVVWQYIHGEFRAGLIDESDIPVDQWRYVVNERPELKSALENPARIGLRTEFVEWMNENVVE
jgi:hypothetical protein